MKAACEGTAGSGGDAHLRLDPDDHDAGGVVLLEDMSELGVVEAVVVCLLDHVLVGCGWDGELPAGRAVADEVITGAPVLQMHHRHLSLTSASQEGLEPCDECGRPSDGVFALDEGALDIHDEDHEPGHGPHSTRVLRECEAGPVPAPIVVAAIALVRDGCVLTVRKEGTHRFMLVGGKLEAGESAKEAALRETHEEVGIALEDAVLLGEFVSEAANEPGHQLHSTVFLADSDAEPVAGGEIAEVRWTPMTGHPDDLAPMLEHHVLPALLDAEHERRSSSPS